MRSRRQNTDPLEKEKARRPGWRTRQTSTSPGGRGEGGLGGGITAVGAAAEGDVGNRATVKVGIRSEVIVAAPHQALGAGSSGGS